MITSTNGTTGEDDMTIVRDSNSYTTQLREVKYKGYVTWVWDIFKGNERITAAMSPRLIKENFGIDVDRNQLQAKYNEVDAMSRKAYALFAKVRDNYRDNKISDTVFFNG